MRLLRLTVRLVAALSLTTGVVVSLSPPAHACGVLGLFCGPAATPAPDPGGDESPDQPVPPAGGFFGFNSQLFVTRQGSSAQELDAATTAGATVHRLPAVWRMLQPSSDDPPVEDTSTTHAYLERLDTFYFAALDRGVMPIFIAYWAPVWATKYRGCKLLDLGCQQIAGSSHKLVPDQPFLDEYQAFVTAVKSRWPRALIESWNEPNLYWNDPQFTGSKAFAATPEQFVAIQCAAYAGSKAVNDDPVLAAGWAGLRYKEYLEKVYAAGGQECWDRANLHTYPGSATELGENTDLAKDFDRTRALRSRYGDDDPIWVTETGYSTTGELRVSESVQADASRRLYNRLASMPDVEAVIFHTLRDAPLPAYPYNHRYHREYGYGFLRENWTPKPVYCGFAARAGRSVLAC